MTLIESPAAPGDVKTIRPQVWLIVFFAVVGITVGVNLLLAWQLDIFGLLRDTHGRSLITARHERKAKYLLNFRYVPQNFDALVIGASSTANWKLAGLTPYRFYNESMLGADGTEERMLVEKALQHGHFKVALIGVAQGVTSRSDLQDGLDQVDPHEALGSVYFYVKALDRLHDKLTHATSDFFPDGSWEFPQHVMTPPDPNSRYTSSTIDPKAVEDQRATVQELLDSGTRVVYVIAPHYGLPNDGSKELLGEYYRQMLLILPPGPVIDLSAPRYAALNSDASLMIDSDHLSDAGVKVYSPIVAERLNEVLRQH